MKMRRVLSCFSVLDEDEVRTPNVSAVRDLLEISVRPTRSIRWLEVLEGDTCPVNPVVMRLGIFQYLLEHRRGWENGA